MFNFLRKNHLFTKLASINLLSKIGDRLFYTAMLTTAAALPQGNIGVMIVSVSETLPILFSFFLGNFADQKQEKINLLIKNSFVRATMYLFIGVLFQYPHTLLILFLASCLNFISDLSGNYSSALIAPFTKTLVHPDDMIEAQGIISTTTQLMNVLATFAGSILLTFFYKSTVAYINALLFVIIAIGYFLIRPKLTVVEKNFNISTDKKPLLVAKDNFKHVFHDKQIFNDLCQLSLLNGFFGGLTPIFVLFVQENQSLAFISNPMKISFLSGLITVCMIVGNYLSIKLFQQTSINKLNKFANFFITLVGISFLLNNIYLVFLNSGIIALLLGIVSPRFSAKIITKFPTSNLGGIVTTVNSFLVLTPPLTSIIFPILANISLPFSYFGMLIYSLALFLLDFTILNTNLHNS